MAGVKIASKYVVPRDVDGNPDPAGVVGFISIGFSNTSREFRQFLHVMRQQPDLHPNLVAVDCARGAVGLEDLVGPTHPRNYWPHVGAQLTKAGVSLKQVQIVWLQIGYVSTPPGPFPSWQLQEQNDLTLLVRALKRRMPNLLLCYVTSRIYGHYSPAPRAGGAGRLRERLRVQVADRGPDGGIELLELQPAQGNRPRALDLVGPYTWADGVVPRSDGLTWRCRDFLNDGVHPSEIGMAKIGQMLLSFFRNDPTTKPWFLSQAPGTKRVAPLATE